MSKLLALLLLGLCATAFASPAAHDDESAEKADGSEAVGPANVKLQFHAPAQYPVHYPFYGYPYGGFNPYYGAAAYSPFAGAHPGFQPFLPHPAAAFPHPAFAAPFYGGFTEEEADIEDESSGHDDEHAEETDASNPWAEAQQNWSNYFSGPTSEFQWPGAEEARPGVHPTLGGTLNPWSPLGAPTHPYPFPMHQGLKNGPNHPRPFTPLGQYYPGSTGLPFAPQFAFGGFNPFFGGFGGQPTYFPAAHNGDMSEDAVNGASDSHAAPAHH